MKTRRNYLQPITLHEKVDITQAFLAKSKDEVVNTNTTVTIDRQGGMQSDVVSGSAGNYVISGDESQAFVASWE